MTELVALVKHDCPVCDRLLPALDAAGVRVVSQSTPGETAQQAARLGLAHVPEVDDGLELSERLDPEAVPALVLLEDGGREADRVEGLQRERIVALAARAGAALDLDGLPEWLPGCASRTRDPDVAAHFAARAARRDGRLRSRELEIGGLHEVPHGPPPAGGADGPPGGAPPPPRPR